MEEHGPNFRIIPDSLWSNIFESPFFLFLDYFLIKNNPDSLEILVRRFEIEEFEELIEEDKEYV